VDVDLLRRAWDKATTILGASADAAAPEFDGIIDAYRATERHYHGIAHISALLALARDHSPLIGDPLAVDLAILFHDVVYDPRRSDNEEMSAQRAEHSLRVLAAPPALIRKVAAWVRTTAHGSTDDAPKDPDLAFLLDVDLSILAASPAHYRAYAAAVRREYDHVPDDQFRIGRARVLQHFLGRSAIYLTPSLRARWEAAARTNLAAELALLDNATGSERTG
jgi:predicted metal-dependent HD superfamily phosphohydrolase